MNTQDQLQQVFADNFVAYWHSHVAHVNTQGRNFVSDHELLGKIYEDLQDQIDHIGELLRSLQDFMPTTLSQVIGSSQIADAPVEGDADGLLVIVRDAIVGLKASYEDLMTVADADGHKEIANYAQDRVLTLAKYIWMLDSTLE